MTTYKKSIKSFILSLSLLLAAVFLISAGTNKVFAYSSNYQKVSISPVDGQEHFDYDIFFDGVKYDNGQATRSTLKDYIDDYADSYDHTNYGVRFTITSPEYSSFTVSLESGGYFDIFFDGVKYDNGQATRSTLKDYIDDYADSYDYSNYAVEFDLLFTDNKRPAISGNEHFASNVDTPTNVQSFIDELSAIDEIDGDISSNIYIVEDNYTTNKNVLGKHQVTVAVEDSSANYSEFIFFVHVSDITDPIVSADFSDKVIGYDKTYDISAFVNTLVLSDNYYSNAELTTTITRDDYTANKTNLGTYRVEISVEDPSENKTKVGFNIIVKDTVKPVFNGIREITKSYKNVMSIQDIIKDIKVTDAIDGDLSNQIVVESDNYTGNADRPSKTPYQILLSVTDAAGNKATHTIQATVIDDIGSNWYITNGVTVNLPKDTPMTRIQIIDLLTRANQVNMSASSIITYSADTYTENVGKPGIYTLAFNVKEPNGNSNDYTYAVNVMGASEDDTDVVPDAVTFIDKVKTWLSDNKVPLIFGTVIVIAVIALVSKAKEQARKNKRRRR